jgi:hypothetical protein
MDSARCRDGGHGVAANHGLRFREKITDLAPVCGCGLQFVVISRRVGIMAPRQSYSRHVALVLAATLLAGLLSLAPGSAADDADAVVAARLAEFLRSARTVISQYQELINDPTKGD